MQPENKESQSGHRISVPAEIVAAVTCQKAVTGLTHDFYRYPARFSPTFARSLIEHFTQPGDLVVDPFMGGGTAMVEARVAGRRAAGTDLSELAHFVTRAKTRALTMAEFGDVLHWGRSKVTGIRLNRRPTGVADSKRPHEMKYLGLRETHHLRRVISLSLEEIDSLHSANARELARCAVLRTAQWALDGRRKFPTPTQFRNRLSSCAKDMVLAGMTFTKSVRRADKTYPAQGKARLSLFVGAAEDLSRKVLARSLGTARLILTSPPYPGVHVLYHRWQILGGKETPAPFWIANKLDGSGANYYTMYGRRRENLDRYYEGIYRSFESLTAICDKQTIVAQLVAFSDIESQLPKYLDAMGAAGFDEVLVDETDAHGARIWRNVPSRRWYANYKGGLPSSREVLLLHRLRGTRNRT